jgi:hypothetical protein
MSGPALDEAARRLAQRRANLGIVKAVPQGEPLIETDECYRDPTRTLVPETLYVVAYVKCEIGWSYGEPKIFVHCKLVDAPHTGKLILRYYNMLPPGRPLRPSHNMFRDFVNLIHRHPPIAGFHPRDMLKDCYVEARVVTVTKWADRTSRPREAYQSKIDTFVRIVEGEPPIKRRDYRPSPLLRARSK